jgi:hypothetical protein
MDITFSVFNGHVNKAHKRAMKLLRKHYPDWATEIETITKKRGGIMGIFDSEPTPATASYSMLVTAFANEKKRKKKKAGAK